MSTNSNTSIVPLNVLDVQLSNKYVLRVLTDVHLGVSGREGSFVKPGLGVLRQLGDLDTRGSHSLVRTFRVQELDHALTVLSGDSFPLLRLRLRVGELLAMLDHFVRQDNLLTHNASPIDGDHVGHCVEPCEAQVEARRA